MSIIRNIMYLMIVMLFISCNEKHDNSMVNEIQRISPIVNQMDFDFLDLIESVEYIPVKEDESVFMKQIHRLFIWEDSFLIKPRRSSVVYFIDEKGNYISKLSPTGEGPLEFSSLYDLSYDPEKSFLFLSDKGSNKILKYNLSSKKVSSSWNTKSSAFNVFSGNEKLYFLVNDFNDGVIKELSLTEGSISTGYVSGPPSFNNFVSVQPFQSYSDTTFINGCLTDTIYYSVGDGVKPYATIGTEENSFSSIDNNSFISDFNSMNFQKYGSYLISMGMFSSYSDLWFIGLMNGSFLLMDKKTGKSSLINSSNLENYRLIFDEHVPIILDTDKEGYAYTYIMLDELFYKAAEEYRTSERYNKFNSINGFISDFPQEKKFENPVIVKFKFNKNIIHLIQ